MVNYYEDNAILRKYPSSLSSLQYSVKSLLNGDIF